MGTHCARTFNRINLVGLQTYVSGQSMCLVMVLGNSIDFCSDDALGISAEPVFVCLCVCMCASVCVCVRVCIVLVPLFGWTMNAVVNYVH